MDSKLSENTENPIFEIDGRVWLNAGGDSFSGHGKIELLEKTVELGSLRKAAAEIKMSYRQAWTNIDKMNKAGTTPVIILKRGGKNGGSAELTPFGQALITRYNKLQQAFTEFLQQQNQNLEI